MATAKQVERRVPPGRATQVTVQVLPESINLLYHPEAPGRRLQLDADDRGIVRFHATALKGAQPTEFHLECHGADGEMELYAISLRADIRYAAWMSGDELTAESEVQGELRPAFKGDPMALKNQELLWMGYPPRPDPSTSPAQYARWLKIVSRSATLVSTRLVAHPEYGEVKRGPIEEAGAVGQGGPVLVSPKGVADGITNHANSHWCGGYYAHPERKFEYIQADWVVPSVYDLPHGPGFSAVVEWVGLDNAGQDLYQAGTGSECLTVGGYQITTYFVWMESLPWSWWEIPNFPVAPKDEISVDIWVASQYRANFYEDDDASGLEPEDKSVWFYIFNATNGAIFMGTYPVASDPVYERESRGCAEHTAEFILERPMINGHLAPLARFTPTAMASCSYGICRDGEYTMFPLGARKGMPLHDGRLTYLNMVDPSNNRLLAEPVVIPDPHNHADAHAILFAWQNYL
jgi:hypothetical protein